MKDIPKRNKKPKIRESLYISPAGNLLEEKWSRTVIITKVVKNGNNEYCLT